MLHLASFPQGSSASPTCPAAPPRKPEVATRVNSCPEIACLSPLHRRRICWAAFSKQTPLPLSPFHQEIKATLKETPVTLKWDPSHSLSPSSSQTTMQLLLLHCAILLPAVKTRLHTSWVNTQEGKSCSQIAERINEITDCICANCTVPVPCKPLVVHSFQTSYYSVSVIHKTT